LSETAPGVRRGHVVPHIPCLVDPFMRGGIRDGYRFVGGIDMDVA